MKIPSRLLSSSLLCAGLLIAGRCYASDASVDFTPFLPSQGGETVEVDLPPALLAIASQAAEAKDPDTAQIIHGLKKVHVNVVKLDDANRADAIAKIQKARESLTGWHKVVTVHDKNGDDVDVRMKVRDDNTIEGIVVTVIGKDNQAVFVNIVGEIKADQISKVAARLQIPGLDKLQLPKKA